MKLQPQLNLKQSQSLVMTPQLQLAIRLLQLNNLELEKKIIDEVEKNPLLERERGSDDIAIASDGDMPDDIPSEPGGGETPSAMDEQMRRGEMLGTGSDTDYENRWDIEETGLGAKAEQDPGAVIEQVVSEQLGLRETLRQQIHQDISDVRIKPVCLALVEWLDEEGYLREDDGELMSALGVDDKTLEYALAQCRLLTPAGVFARSLTDCLGLQLRVKGLWTPAHEAMLSNMEMIMRGELGKLARLCNVRPAELDRMIHDLRALDPHPARLFEKDVFQARPPEIIITEDDRQELGYRIELNEETLPRIVVLSGYWQELADRKMSKQDRKYLQDSYQSGQWLVRAMNQRAASMLQVAREICRRQQAFFAQGISGLKPMIMRDVADELDMHESTVSRVVANKLVQTPRGVFEMRYFFTSAIASADGGEAHSAEAVRARIRELIDTELEQGAKKVLSDEAIARVLKDESMDIARRTVAKYREAMNLPTSAERKRAAKLRKG